MKFKRLTETAIMPTRATEGSAGFDLYADEHVRLQPNERRLVHTGIAFAIPEGYEGQIRPRSGLAHKHGLTVVNAPGTIDSDYRGEVLLNLWHTGSMSRTLPSSHTLPFEFWPGERIAQLVVVRLPHPPIYLVEVDELDETGRGAGGHGSTGR